MSKILLILSFIIVHESAGKSFTDPPGQMKNGLLGEYFNSSNFEDKVYSRIDPEINFYYYYRSPAPGVEKENYSIRWTGKLLSPVTGEYEFIVRVDDGIRLWIDDKKIIDQWKRQEARSFSAKINLEGGKFYNIKVEYFNGPTTSEMRLFWKSPQDKEKIVFGLIDYTPEKIIPSEYLFVPTEERPITEEKEAEKPLTIPTEPKISKRKPKPFVKKVEKEAVVLEDEIFTDLNPGDIVTLRNVLFEQSSYELLEAAYPELNKLFNTLKKSPSLKIDIAGHTDNIGDPKLNQILSLQRAKVISAYLVRKGIQSDRIEPVGYGGTRPVADNSNEIERIKNRRVEFMVK